MLVKSKKVDVLPWEKGFQMSVRTKNRLHQSWLFPQFRTLYCPNSCPYSSRPDLFGEKNLILFRAIFWFESNYEKLMPEKIEEASECVELLIMQKQLTVTQKVISIKMVNW